MEPYFAATAGANTRKSSDCLTLLVRNTSIVPHINRISWQLGRSLALPSAKPAGASPSRNMTPEPRTLNPAFYSNPNVPAGGTSMPVRRVTLRLGRNRGSTRKLKLTLPFD